MTNTIKVDCPICGTTTLYDTKNEFRPFCSERCKVIDLGAWADESYRIKDKKLEDIYVSENNEDTENSKY
jgi:endogenous inhibitor of DNA gyrase (YacG/DUF329 family)